MKSKNIIKKYYLEKVIREINGGSHYVCRQPVEFTGKVFAVFFSLLTQFCSK